MRSLLRRLALLGCCLITIASAANAQTWGKLGKLQIAPNSVAFHAGTLVNTLDNDCAFFDPNGVLYYSSGFITAAWVAYQGDPNAGLPKAGDIYYTEVFVSNPAACQSASVQPWLLLPANTFLAISATNPVVCYKNGVQVACSQSPQLGYSLSGAYGYNLGVWPNLKGGNIDIYVPVSTSAPGPATLQARVDTADGWLNPSSQPQVSYIVGAGSSLPTISYPAPSTTLITDTTARTTVNLNTPGTTGTLYFDLGWTTAYEVLSISADVTAPGNYVPAADWSGLVAGTTYHWRSRYVYGSGATALGADQSFTTTGTVLRPGAPVGVASTAVSPTSVSITWNPVNGATSYQVFRRTPGVLSYGMIGTTSVPSFVDNGALANSAYAYKIRSVNSAGTSLFDSSIVASVTVVYTDDPLIEFGSPIRAAHIAQLRTAVNALRLLANQGPAVFAEPIAPGRAIKANDIIELRNQYDSAISSITGRASSWAGTVAPGAPVVFTNVQQLRDRLK